MDTDAREWGSGLRAKEGSTALALLFPAGIIAVFVMRHAAGFALAASADRDMFRLMEQSVIGAALIRLPLLCALSPIGFSSFCVLMCSIVVATKSQWRWLNSLILGVNFFMPLISGYKSYALIW